jgi:hypothetical protein
VILVVLIVLLVASVAGALYLMIFYSPTCQNYECFRADMIKCSKVAYINEGTEATWGYSIEGIQGKDCVINVKFLQAKKGDLGLTALEGSEMKCYYPLGTADYPEKDLGKCHGVLKEELQTIVINKLHSYILENLGKFTQELKAI